MNLSQVPMSLPDRQSPITHLHRAIYFCIILLWHFSLNAKWDTSSSIVLSRFAPQAMVSFCVKWFDDFRYIQQ